MQSARGRERAVCVCARERASSRASKAIFYEIESSTWVGRPSLQFHEGLFFALYTFSRSKRALKRAPRSKFRVSVRLTYSDTTSRGLCGISSARRRKIEPPLYTDFTPALRTKEMMRSTIGAVI